MNSLVVHFSKFGNTRMVAEAIAEVLAGGGQAQVVALDRLGEGDLASAELVVVGSPTHNGNLPKAIRPTLEGLPRRSLRGKATAAFDTSYKMNAFLSRFTAARPLARRLRKLGGRQLVRPETFHVEGREGPLFDGELDRARAWAGSLLELAGARE